MKTHKLILSILLISSNAFAHGVINPNITQGNINQTICKPGWTDTIRPASNYTNRLKQEQLTALKLPGSISEYEADHIIPLGLGGHPSNPLNYQLQLWPEARRKDVVEVRLHNQVCEGKMTLDAAQAVFINELWDKQ